MALVLLMMVTHPVPVLLVLCIAGLDCALRWLTRTGIVEPALRSSCGAFLLSCLSILYILHFTDRQRVAQSVSGPASSHLITLVRFLKLSPLAIFAGSTWSTYLYRLALYAVLLWAAVVAWDALRQTASSRFRFLARHTWFVVAVAAPIILAIIPSDMPRRWLKSERNRLPAWRAAPAFSWAYPKQRNSRRRSIWSRSTPTCSARRMRSPIPIRSC